jgi:DnaJ-class molecular chaperone
MDEKEIGELLTRSRECQVCGGTGKVSSGQCDKCHGNGYILDSVITDLLISHGIKGREMVDVAEAIFEHYEDKLMESYKRGARENILQELKRGKKMTKRQ